MSDEWSTNNNSGSTHIQARLWSLLQQKMVEPCAWPRWNPDILNLSTLTDTEQPDTHMLDETWLNPDSQQGCNRDHFDHFSNSQETLLGDDSGLDLDDDILDSEDLMDIQRWAEPQRSIDPTFEDEMLDEDLFWAELEIRSDNPSADETLFEDILEPSGIIGEPRLGPKNSIGEVGQDMHRGSCHDGPGVAQINSSSVGASNEDFTRRPSLGNGFKELLSNEPDMILDGCTRAENGIRPSHNSIWENSHDFDGSVDRCLAEVYCDNDMLDGAR